MTRAPKPTKSITGTVPSASDADGPEIVQIKVWLLGISPMVGVAARAGAEHLHVAWAVRRHPGRDGWEVIHLYQFRLRAARYGSWKLSASSPDVTLAARQGLPT